MITVVIYGLNLFYLIICIDGFLRSLEVVVGVVEFVLGLSLRFRLCQRKQLQIYQLMGGQGQTKGLRVVRL